MGVLMQAFYWDCPKIEGREFQWWQYIKSRLNDLQRTGFTAILLPPPYKASDIISMGYDPYDYYDLGEYDQKGGRPTWFGGKESLLDLIETARRKNMQVIADIVLNHNSGADEEEYNPIIGRHRWTGFRPGSGRFPRNWECFHPCYYASHDNMSFGEMPDLCHTNPYVHDEIVNYAKWMYYNIGFDGFRYDFAKGYDGRIIGEIHSQTRAFGIGEYWDSFHQVEKWLDIVNQGHNNRVMAFDFDTRTMLRELCECCGFSLKMLCTWETLAKRRPFSAVTFVENHDTRRGDKAIYNDKLLAYSYILTHEGYPCVFWRDYYSWGLGKGGTRNGIAVLVYIHERYAGGYTSVLYADDSLYIMERSGHEDKQGLVYALNNLGDRWNGTRVRTKWINRKLEPSAWWSSHDLSEPGHIHTDWRGEAEIWAPPRGYAVYTPL